MFWGCQLGLCNIPKFDILFEGDEEFYLTIDKSLSPIEIIFGYPNRAVVKIFDNECK